MRDVAIVRTPENVEFELERANVAVRGAAWALDAMIMGLFLGAVSVGLNVLAVFENLHTAILGLAFFAIQWGYGFAFDLLARGRTPGKRFLGLRVLGDDGLRLTAPQAAIRNILRVIDSLPVLYLVGAVAVLIDPRGRRLGDMAAGTMVVRERSARLAPRNLVLNLDPKSLGPYAAQAVRRVTPDERALLLRLAAVRETLPIHVRAELFGTLAAHLIERLEVPRPEHLSAENYVLQIAARLS